MDMTNVMKGIEKEASERVQMNECDYIGEDGLWVCGKCHTPKQTRIAINGINGVVQCLCKCEAEKRDAEDREQKRKQRASKIEELKRLFASDPDLEKRSFENDDHANEELSTLARNYVKDFDKHYKSGKGLLLYGDVGSGKTFAAACIANALTEQGYFCLITDFKRLANVIGGIYEGRQEMLDQLNRFHLIVIDDLSSERDTEYMTELVETVVDARYRSGKPLIITTNQTASELRRPSDVRRQRVHSRLYEMCYPYEVKGEDRRRRKLKESYHSAMKKLLGA